MEQLIRGSSSTLASNRGSLRQIQGESWEVVPEADPFLAKLLESPGEIITTSSLRAVTRHSLDGKTFYMKTYFHSATFLAPLKYFFKIPASRAEWQLAPRLQGFGIPVVPHLAHGERWNWRGLQKSILITEGPPGFVSLKSILPSTNVQIALGNFLRRLHDCSVFHTDLHVSNLLYSPQANEFCLVDLDNIKILPSLTRQQRMDNLATLNRRWPLTPDFYEAYDFRFLSLAGEIIERAESKHRASIPKKLKLLFGNRVLFAQKKFGGFMWHVRLHPWNEKLEPILTEPDEFLATRARILKNGTRSTVGAAHGFVLKRSNLIKPQNLFFDLFRGSRARRAFRAARHLELFNIATPRPIAMSERRCFGFVVRSYFVMEEISQGVSFSKWRGDRRTAIERAATLIAKLHDEGFIHRDLRESNILFRPDGQPSLIDLDALFYVKRTPAKRAAADLARLMQAAKGELKKVPATRRLRFLKKYCAARRLENWRWWWNQIARNLPAPKLSK